MKKTLALMLLLAGLTLEAQGRTLTWAPTPDNNSWDTTTANWLDEDGKATVFQNGDDVVFSDTGLAVLECELAPTRVQVNTSGYIFFQAGFQDVRPGRLTGSMQLIKNGSGTLAIECANSYTGGTVLNEGTIEMYNSNAFGTGGITLNGGTLDLQQRHIDSDKVILQGYATINNGSLYVGENKTFTLDSRLSGTVGFTLGDNATLDLQQHDIDSDKVTLKGAATINNGIIVVAENKTFTLGDRLSGTVSFTLGDNARLDLGQNTISSSVTLQGKAFIGNGSIDHNITVGQNKNLTLLPNTTISGVISLEGDATLDLGENDIDSDKVTLNGAATINNGIIVVAENKTFTLGDRLSGTVSFTLGDNAKLNLGQSTIDSDKVILQGYARIDNGSLYVGENKTFTLDSRLSGTVSFTLGDNARLDLGQNTISSSVTLQGKAFIGNGRIDYHITVGQNKNLTLLEKTTISRVISLEGDATLNLGGNAIDSNKLALQGSAIIGNGTINGNLAMELGYSLTLLANTTITGGITLGDAATLNLGQNDTIEGGITLGNNATLFLGQNDTIADGITLGDDAMLDLGQNTISSSVTLQGSAFIGNGVLNSDLAVVAGKELWLYSGDLTGSGVISLGNEATLHVGNRGFKMGCGVSGSGTIVMSEYETTASITGSMKDFSGSVEVKKGTLNIMNIDDAAKLNVADVTIAANGVLGVYKSETAAEANEGVLTITGGHKLTAGKDARLNADLVMGGGVEASAVLDVSANLGDGGLEMGSTVTLNPGSVLLSDADMDAIGELGFMGKYDLFNGVDGLSLGGDFLSELGLADKWVKAADVFANPVLSAEKDYYLFYSGVNRGGVGGNVGTVYLMQIPEPATGTLSLLALAALAARRRRK
ncbi:MAG: autotransporter-associated beta strand repeat-containing protein [Akkermansia sp.]|nr:autotransporter-associated beta strand repeat-containing protein [Akkermansia sp.]